MQEELLKRLDSLAEQLGTTVEYLWPLLIKQQYMEGLMNLVVWVPALLLVAVGYVLYMRWAIKNEKLDIYNEGWFALAIGWGVVTMLSLIGLPFAIHYGIMHVLVPEAYALQVIGSLF